MAIPDKSALTNTYILTLLFCLPFAGTEQLFAFMVTGQILFIILVFLCFRKDAPSLLLAFKHTHAITFYLFIGWLMAMAISLSVIFTTDTNGWQRAAAIARQLFILIQIGFCLSLMRFLVISGKPGINLLLSFGMGFIGMVFLHFSALYWGPWCESETWLKDPLLSPNMRDIGDMATAAIAIFAVTYWFNRKPWQSAALWLLFTISWAYLLWSGGRTAIASAFAVTLLTMGICRLYVHLPLKKIALTTFGLLAAYLLCVQFSIYDWNGIVRYSAEWKPGFNPSADITSGRMAMWKWSIDVFLQAPWFGHGPFSFFFLPERYANRFWHDHPHNLIMQCLIEWGIIGTVFVSGLLLSLAIIGMKKLPGLARVHNGGFLAAAAAILVLTLGSLTGGSYWDFQPVMILVTLFAVFPLLPSLTSTKAR